MNITQERPTCGFSSIRPLEPASGGHPLLVKEMGCSVDNIWNRVIYTFKKATFIKKFKALIMRPEKNSLRENSAEELNSLVDSHEHLISQFPNVDPDFIRGFMVNIKKRSLLAKLLAK